MTINEYLREGGRRKLLVVAVGVVVVVLAASITTGVVVGNKKRQSSSPVEEVDSELIIDVVSRYPPTAQPVLPSIIIKAPTGAQEEDENEDEDTTKKPSQAPQTDTDNEDEDSTKQPTASEEKDRYLPHILMVIMDDLGSGDLGIHGSGITTDVADELAKDGHFLNNFYVLPTCTTTRTALMTGRLPYQMGLYDVFQGGTGMPADEETLAQVLRKVGYRTHAVGKWHLGESQYKYLPTFRGFQSFYGFAGGGSANYFNHVNLRDAYVMRYDKEEFCGKGCAQFPDDRNYYSSFVFAREASRVVLNHKNKDEPLFLYLAFQSVHTPLQLPQRYLDRYQNKNWDLTRKMYAGMLTAADEALGMVIDTFVQQNLWNDTLVVYMTDNGGFLRHCLVRGGNKECGDMASNGNRRGQKLQVWEGGVHGDGFLSGPALEKLGIRAGTQNDALFHALDWVPTLAAMVGAPLEGKPVDGVNQLDTLRGGAEAREELFLGFSYDSKSQGGVADAYTAVREGRWKLVRHPDRKTYELFDLVNDPWENKDMSSGQQDQVDYLKKRMLAYENTFIEPMEAEEACSRVTEYDVTDWDQLAAVPWC